MKKKEYNAPAIHAVAINLSQTLAFSGGDEQNAVKIGNQDDGDDDNRSRRFNCVWDDEEDM